MTETTNTALTEKKTGELRTILEQLTGEPVGSKNRQHLIAKIEEAQSPTFGLAEQAKAYDIPISKIDESPFNKRRLWGDMDELAASIKSKGIQQPGTVRPIEGGRYEIVFGHRRFRGTIKAGHVHFPAFVRAVSDREVLELQVIENLQRKDVHPLDEAAWFYELHTTHNVSVEELAARISKSKSHVYSRLKLMELSEVARDAFLDGKVVASIATIIARVPHQNMQKKIVDELLALEERNGSPATFRDAADLIQHDYMLRLENAPFNTKDAKLVEGAGTCAACPKRTGNQPELFADVEAKNLCTDPLCHKAKKEATYALRIAKAKAAGDTVLDAKASKKVLPWAGGPGSPMPYNNPYVDLDSICIDDEKKRTWRQITKKSKPALVIGRDAGGAIRELITVEDARKGAKAIDVEVHLEGEVTKTTTAEFNRATERQAMEHQACQIAGETACGLIATACEKRKLEVGVLRLLVESLQKDSEGTMKRRGFDYDDDPEGEKWTAWLAGATEKQLRGIMVELIIEREFGWLRGEPEGISNDLVNVFDLDWKALVDAEKTKLREAAKKAKAEAKAKGTKATTPKDSPEKGKADDSFDEAKCRECGCTDSMACPGGCTWVETDLCSACKDKGAK